MFVDGFTTQKLAYLMMELHQEQLLKIYQATGFVLNVLLVKVIFHHLKTNILFMPCSF